MRLLRDEQAYLGAVDEFVTGRVDASAFVACFQRLWKCDASWGVEAASTTDRARENRDGLYGAMDSVNALCDAYAGGLPPGHGYRVSEEQFRKEIASVTAWLGYRGLDRT